MAPLRTSSRHDPSTATLSRDERRFLAWLAQLTPEVRSLSAKGERPAVSLDRLCEEVASSTYPLPRWLAARLGMPAGTPIGEAASALHDATHAPDGPRCPSYRAAAGYLRRQRRVPSTG